MIEIELLNNQLTSKKVELSRWSNYANGNDGDLAKNQTYLTSLSKQNEIKGVIDNLNERLKEKEEQKELIIGTIDKFKGIEHKILKLKYVDSKTLLEIADETGYSYSYIKSKHAELMRLIRFNQ